MRDLLATATDPLVLDLGYCSLPVTTGLADHFAVRPDVRMLRLKLDPGRVAAAGPRRGGFEPAGEPLSRNTR